MNPLGRGSGIPPTSGYSSQDYRSEVKNIILISCLKLREQAERWAEEIKSMPPLNDDQKSMSFKASYLFKEDMSPTERVRVIDMCLEGGDAFIEIAQTFDPNLDAKKSLTLYERLLKPVTIHHENFISLISNKNLDTQTASLLFTFEEDEWEMILDFAHWIWPQDRNIQPILKLLVPSQNREGVIDAVYVLEKDDASSHETCMQTLEYCLSMPANTLFFFNLMRGAGTKKEKRHFFYELTCMSDVQRQSFMPILFSLSAENTPISALKKVLWQLWTDIYPLNEILREFYASLRTDEDVANILISDQGPVINTVLEALKRNAPCKVEFYYSAGGKATTQKVFERAIAEVPTYFGQIFLNGPDGFVLKTSSNSDDLEKASDFGIFLLNMIEQGVYFPKEIRFAPHFFANITTYCEQDLAADRDYIERIMALHVARAFYHQGKAKPSKYIGSALCEPTLPPLNKIRMIDPLKLRIFSTSGYEDVPPAVLALFNDDDDISKKTIDYCLKDSSFDTAYLKAAPLFTEQDSAEHRLQLIDLAKGYSNEQIKCASFVILEGDSIEDKEEILKNVPINAPRSPLPICLEDRVKARIEIATVLGNLPGLQKTASLFPPSIAPSHRDRLYLIDVLANAGFDQLSAEAQEKLLLMIRFTPHAKRMDLVNLLKRLSPEQLCHAMDAFSLFQLQCISKFANKLSVNDPSLSDEAFTYLSGEFAEGRFLYIEQTNDFIYPDFYFDSISTFFITLCTTPHKSNFCDLMALYKDENVEYFDEFVRAFSFLTPSQRNFIIPKCRFTVPTQKIMRLFALTHEERVKLFEIIDSLMLADDFDDTFTYIFRLIVQIKFDEMERVRDTIQNFIVASDSPTARYNLFRYTLFDSDSLDVVHKHLTNSYCAIMKYPFPDHVDHHVKMPIVQGPVIPQLSSYINRPLELIMHVQRPGDPALDYGGPTREVLVHASREIGTFFSSYLMKDVDGAWTLKAVAGNLKEEEMMAYASLGRLLYLMTLNQVPQDASSQLSKSLLLDLASYPVDYLNKRSLKRCIEACKENVEELKELFFAMNPHAESAISDDKNDLIDFIIAKEPHFQVARALSKEATVAIRPYITNILYGLQDLRRHLANESTWTICSQLPLNQQGDYELFTSHLFRWISEASDEEIERFLFAITGLRSCGPGMKLKIEIKDIDGPDYHSCFDTFDVPPIPLEGEEDPKNFRDYDQWKVWILGEIPTENWNI